MLSRNVESKIEQFKNEYVGSLKERQEIKDAYIKCKGNIANILKYIPYADGKSKKRITKIVHQMVENGEIVKFPDEPRILTQNTINNEATSNIEAPGISGFSNISTSSRAEEQTMDINTHIGVDDILKINPSFMNDSRSTAITDYKRTATGKENLLSELNSQTNNASDDNLSDTSTVECTKCHDTPKRKFTKLLRNVKKLKLDDKSTNRNKLVENNDETLIVINFDDRAQITEATLSNESLLNNKDGLNILKQTSYRAKEIRSSSKGSSNIKAETSQKKVIHTSVDKQTQDGRINKPGPSCCTTMPFSSAHPKVKNSERQIPNKNMANSNQINNEIFRTKGLDFKRDQSTLNTDLKRTTTPKKHLNPSKQIQLLQNVPLKRPKTEAVHAKIKPKHLSRTESPCIPSNQECSKRQTPNINLLNAQIITMINNTLINLQQTVYPVDHLQNANPVAIEKNVLPNAKDATTSKAINSTVSNFTKTHKNRFRLQDNTELTTTSSQSQEANKKRSVQNEQKFKCLEKSKTSQSKIRNKEISKTASKERPTTTNTSLGEGRTKINITKTGNINEMSSKSSSRDSSKSVCSKGDATKTETFIGKALKTKNEKMKYTENCLILIRELFSKYIIVLPAAEKKVMKIFNDADNKGQCICLELLASHKQWYNVLNFSAKVRPDMEHSDIFEIVTSLKENGIVDMDYQREHEVVLLNQLSKDNLIKICDNLERQGLNIYDKHKSEEKLNRQQIIEIIRKHCNTKSKIELLRENIQSRMGICMKLNENFQQVFYTVYLLGTYTNPRFLKMEDYFKCILLDKVTFPEYAIDKYAIFTSWTDFLSYSKAKMYAIEFKNFSHDAEELRQICGKIFAELKLFKNKRSDHEKFKDAPHLIQFTAKAVYVTTLSDASDKLLAKYPEVVKEWLEYMIRYMKVEFPHEIGRWYHNLIQLYMKFLKPFDYNRAAEELIRVAVEEKQNLSDVQLHRIFEKGRQLVKKDDIFAMNKDRIVELEVELLRKRIQKFPETIGDEKAELSNREYYNTLLHSTWGCDLILATFTLLFFDIIYNMKKFVPGTFVSGMQSEPLDMNTRYFYPNRKNEIDQRLEELSVGWPDEKVLSFLKETYVKHSHELLFCKIDAIDAKDLENVVQGFGRKILAKICRRLAENFTEHRNGFPDLLVSNTEKKRFFRMVKRSSHQLSVEQMLWLDYLRSDETEVGIIVIPPSNKKNIKKIEKDLPSTSSAPKKIP